MITTRERYLMREAMKVAEDYDNVDDWLEDSISDYHVVEQLLDHAADEFERVNILNGNTKPSL